MEYIRSFLCLKDNYVLICHDRYIWSRLPGPSGFDRRNNESFQLGNVFRVMYYEFTGLSCLASVLKYISLQKA
jgi:hypothetical protein